MSRRLPRPYFPIPPEQYQRAYFSEVIRAFSVFLEQIQNPGDVRATEITITNLPTDDSGLETGTLFQHDGYVRVPLTHSAFLRGSQGIGTVGTVTVSVS